jgi:hypothetical protein
MHKAFLTLALVALLALPVLAQRGQRAGGMFGLMDGTALLGNKSVQDELKLSDDQKKDIKAATDARLKAFRAAMEDMDREAMQKAGQEFTKSMTRVREKLTSAQAKRLFQIEVQVATKNNSTRVFQYPEVQKALKFTEKQQKLVKSTISDFEKDVKKLMEESKGDGQKMFANMKKIRERGKEAYTTITRSLDDTQQKALKDLGGEKFELKMQVPLGGGRPGRGQKDKKKDDL